jgi:hypothetical protein
LYSWTNAAECPDVDGLLEDQNRVLKPNFKHEFTVFSICSMLWRNLLVDA